MKKYKIYDTLYDLSSTSPVAPDTYAFRNRLTDVKPRAKFVGYVVMEDGSTIECYSKLRLAYVIIPIVALWALLSVVPMYLKFFQPKDAVIADFVIKQGVDKNIVSYNGFMSANDNFVNIFFTNGDEPCTIRITGDGISSDTISLGSNEFIESIPVAIESTDVIIEGKLVIQTATSSREESVVIEVPSNQSYGIGDNEPAVTDGYWKGEYVYGIDIKDTE